MGYRNDFKTASEQSTFAANALLWRWLQSGTHRAALYRELRESDNPILEFESRITVEEDDGSRSSEITRNQQKVYLLTSPEHIEKAFQHFSNEPYKALGTGNPVVLASDNNDEDQHQLKRQIVSNAFMLSDDMPGYIQTVAAYACHHALVLSKKQDDFDFVKNVAEEAALIFVEGLYGIEFKNHPVLHDAMEGIYDGMAYQMLARHFITEPVVPVKAMQGAGALITILDSTLQEALNPPLLTGLSDLIGRSGKVVKAALSKLLALADVGAVKEYVQRMHDSLDTEENIPFHAYQLIDHAMNLYRVRVWVADELTSDLLEGAANYADSDKEIIRELVDLIKAHRKEKEAPDDHLVPLNLDKEGRKVSDPNADYHFRETVISRLVNNPDIVKIDAGYLTGTQFITELAGAISGTVGNFISSSSIAIREIIRQGKGSYFRELAMNPNDEKLQGQAAILIMEALRLDPPAPFLPRLVASGDIADRTFSTRSGKIVLDEGANVLIPMGSYTRGSTTSDNPDQFNENRDPVNLQQTYKMVYGQPEDNLTSHNCIGWRMAMPFIQTLLANVFSLHNLDFKEQDTSVDPLKKKWGFVCESLALDHKTSQEIRQQPLNVVMKIKTPIAVHAEYLKKIVYYGAPFVETLLNDSDVVHFARFIILNDDTELAMITTYDGGYDEYLEYFAEKAGPLFDMIFEHIQDAPPMPVRDNRQAFADHIARYNLPSLGGYFYSAYPDTYVADVKRMVKFCKLQDSSEISREIEEAEKKKAGGE